MNETTYYYVASATNSLETSPDSAEVSAKPIAAPVPATGDVIAQYRVGDTNPGDNQIRPLFRVVNKGKEAVDLKTVKLRYYFTVDGDKPQEFHCDYAQLGSGNVQGRFMKLDKAVTGADYYLEISFGAGEGSLAAGANTGDIQVRLNKTDWSN
ncbi:UNVERIFIED_CONTAM: hypothetical protein ABIC26_002993 [Paenibacillus sp. PvR008]